MRVKQQQTTQKLLEKTMKKLAIATFVLCSTIGMSNQAKAQYMSNDPMQQINQLMNSMGDPMADFQRLVDENNRRLAALQRDHAKYQQQTIAHYRKMTNDYTSSDQVILQRSMAEARRQNPELFRASEALHRQRMADLQSNFQTGQRINQTNQEILDMGMRGFQNRMASSDRIQHNEVNGIWGRSDFYDHDNGQIYNLQSNQTNVWQWDNDDTFFGDQSGTQWRHTGNGFWSELEEIR